MNDEREAGNGERGRLFGVARDATGAVPAARRDALRASILAAAAASAVTATTTAATAAAAAPGTVTVGTAGASSVAATVTTSAGLGVVAKTIVGGLIGVLVGGVIVGTATVLEAPSPVAPSSTAGAMAPPAIPASAPPLASAAPAVSAPAPSASAPPSTRPVPLAVAREIVKQPDDVASPDVRPAPVSSTLVEETAALREVSRALAEGKSDEALRLLDRPAAGTDLGEERAAARIVALCQAGRSEEAQPSKAAFFANFPRSTQRDRIERACATASPR